MFHGIEILTVVSLIMQANVLRRFQPRNVGRPVVAAIKIHVMAMRPRDFVVNFVPQIPLISQAMRRIKIPVDRLINRFIAAE